MYLFKNLNLLIQRYLPKDQIKLLREAHLVARDAHQGQTRSSGEPYITHPVAVACILAEMQLDHETLMAALLHDVIEDTPTTYQDMEKLFGKNVAELVEGVSKLDKLKFRDKKEAQAENFRKMIMAMVQDIRVVLIKLADRTHNMRTLGALRPDKRRRIARETLEIYSLLAHRLGIHHLKTELEELGFKALYPNHYRVVKKVVKAARSDRKEMRQKILLEIEGHLTGADISCRVNGREKHLYSIYCKMYLKEQRFHSMMDIYSFRVIVSDVDTCYRVLGQMHSLYKPRPGRVKDYIAIPKANGYQSLHTSMIGPHGMPIEVQICTENMDQMAEMGVAAHWAYKKQGEIDITAQIRLQRWMQSLLELQQNADSSFEFIESVKSDLFPEEIYVFTPKGSIIELPAGATPVDFAYAVHSDIGHACVGTRVDRQAYPLSQALCNGQTVEIITSPDARPNITWLNFVVSSKARVKIRQMLKHFNQSDSITLGRHLLNQALGGNRKLVELPVGSMQRDLNRTKLATLNDLLTEIDLGNAISVIIAKHLQGDKSNLMTLTNRCTLSIKNPQDLLITFAKYFQPLSGQPIIIYVTPGKELLVHYESCRNIQGYQKRPEQFIPVKWKMVSPQKFITEIKMDMFNHQSALANLTTSINTINSNLQRLNTEKKNIQNIQVYRTFIRQTAQNRIHLVNIMRIILIIPNVIQVNRNKK